MGYSVIRGGTEAMLAAEAMLEAVRLGLLKPEPDRESLVDGSDLVAVLVGRQRHAVDRVTCEAGFHAPDLAALALIQAEGDTTEASFILRAVRASMPRWGTAQPIDTGRMRVIRRISSAFKDVPGGQLLGPTRDYTLRFLREDLLQKATREQLDSVLARLSGNGLPLPEMPRVIDILRETGLLRRSDTPADEAPVDITMEPLRFPRPPRSARLQALARGETGMMNGLAYSSLRGYGHVHPTLGELRMGHAEICVMHPAWGIPVTIGEIPFTECDSIVSGVGMVTAVDGGTIQLDLGYGAAFGQQEARAISMSILDACLSNPDGTGPVDDPEFVLYHIDGVESLGFVEHLKQPHYTLFASVMDRLAAANAWRAGANAGAQSDAPPDRAATPAGSVTFENIKDEPV